MYLLWHLIFAVLLALVLYRVTAANPAGPYLATVISAGVLPDVDHLLNWSPKYFSRILPRYLWEGLALVLRRNVYGVGVCLCVLHFWIWPLLLLVGAVLMRRRKIHVYLLAAAAGWALHLASDGVLAIV